MTAVLVQFDHNLLAWRIDLPPTGTDLPNTVVHTTWRGDALTLARILGHEYRISAYLRDPDLAAGWVCAHPANAPGGVCGAPADGQPHHHQEQP